MILLIQCADKIGLVAQIAGVIQRSNLNIDSMREHVDKDNNRFFARLDITDSSEFSLLKDRLREVLPIDSQIWIQPPALKKVVVMVTKEYHCLSDILVRNHFKTLGATVQAVIGNHDLLKDIADRFGIPFHLSSHLGRTESEYEAQMLKIFEGYQPDYIVLAKYFRILSSAFIEHFPKKIINIHHSFLPAFIGAHPYKQAFERGVKLIGATAHFVTEHLDEGPIIAQQIIPINHTFNTKDLVNAGKEIETSVLARALKLVFEDRVLIYNNKTVVFE